MLAALAVSPRPGAWHDVERVRWTDVYGPSHDETVRARRRSVTNAVHTALDRSRWVVGAVQLWEKTTASANGSRGRQPKAQDTAILDGFVRVRPADGRSRYQHDAHSYINNATFCSGVTSCGMTWRNCEQTAWRDPTATVSVMARSAPDIHRARTGPDQRVWTGESHVMDGRLCNHMRCAVDGRRTDGRMPQRSRLIAMNRLDRLPTAYHISTHVSSTRRPSERSCRDIRSTGIPDDRIPPRWRKRRCNPEAPKCRAYNLSSESLETAPPLSIYCNYVAREYSSEAARCRAPHWTVVLNENHTLLDESGTVTMIGSHPSFPPRDYWAAEAVSIAGKGKQKCQTQGIT